MNVFSRRMTLAGAGVVLAIGLVGCSSDSPTKAGSTPTGGRTSATSVKGSAGTRTSAGPVVSGPSGSAARTTTGGAEQPTTTTKPTCSYASSAMVASAFGGTVASEALSTSGTGNALCRYTLSRTNLSAPGTVALTLNTKGNAGVFAKVKQQYMGAITVSGIGQSAFFAPADGVFQFISGTNVVVMETSVRIPGSAAPDAQKLQADATALGKAIAAEL